MYRETYFEGLIHMIMEAAICRLQAGGPGEPVVQFSANPKA